MPPLVGLNLWMNDDPSFGPMPAEEKFFRNEELEREMDDADSLTEERLDKLLDKVLRDITASTVAERGWPTEFLAYKVAKRP
ncbi:hypothetical protein ABZP36_003014 [Zizania latifolia]